MKICAFSDTIYSYTGLIQCAKCGNRHYSAIFRNLFCHDITLKVGLSARLFQRFFKFSQATECHTSTKTEKAAVLRKNSTSRFSENSFYDIAPSYLRLFLPFHISFRRLLTKRVFVWYNIIAFSTLMRKISMG